MAQYRKKPVVIEAEQFFEAKPLPFYDQGVVCYGPLGSSSRREVWYIQTLEGPLHVSEGDWVIRGVKGEYYPCKPDIFEATYEEVTRDA